VHNIDIPRWAVDRVIKRRGAEHVFEDFDPARTALIVIDMQNAFMLPGVAFVVIKTAPEIAPNINRLATAVRSAGGTVVWIRMTYTDQASVDWSACCRLSTPEINQRRSDAGERREGASNLGHPGSTSRRSNDREDPLLRTHPGIKRPESVLARARHRHADHHRLPHRPTARDAMMLNYNAIMVTDANAADTDDDHNNALTAFYTTFGDIMPTDMIVSLLGQ
jgi:ureidoacrylate peracid hydrolase